MPPQAVLDQVLDDPVRREELRGGGDVLALDHLADDLVLLLGDVELVQPADDLDLLPVFLVDLVDQLADQRVGMQQVVGQQQFGLVVDPLEQKRHGRVQGVALGDEQHAVQLGFLGAVELEVDDLVLVEARQIDMLGVFEDLRASVLPFGMAQDAVAVVEVAVQLHEANRHKPVEPGVGHRLHRLLEALLLRCVLPSALPLWRN